MPHPRRPHLPPPRSTHPPRGGDGLAAKTFAAVLLLFLIAAPWPFGGVEMTRWLWPVPLALVAGWTLMLGRASAPTPVAPWAAVPVLLGLAFAAFQLTPLPGDWL